MREIQFYWGAKKTDQALMVEVNILAGRFYNMATLAK
jgi:hypothetical protein